MQTQNASEKKGKWKACRFEGEKEAGQNPASLFRGAFRDVW